MQSQKTEFGKTTKNKFTEKKVKLNSNPTGSQTKKQNKKTAKKSNYNAKELIQIIIKYTNIMSPF